MSASSDEQPGHEWLRRVVDLVDVACFEVDTRGVITRLGGTAERTFEGPHRLVGRRLEELAVSAADADRVRGALASPKSVRNLRVDLLGTKGPRTCKIACEAAGPRGRAVIVRDETQSREAEQALQLSEARFRKVFQTSPDAITLTRVSDGKLVDVNEGFEQVTGYSPQEAIGRTSTQMGLWSDAESRARMLELVQTQGYCTNFETRFRTKDDRIIWGSFSARLIELDGELHIVSVARDIDDLRRSQDALRASEAHFKALFEGAGNGILLLDDEGWIQEVNAAACAALQRSREELLARRWVDLLDRASVSRGHHHLERVLEEGSAVVEVRHRLRRDDAWPTEVNLRRIRIEDRTRVLAVLHDLTERYELQGRLLRSQRLEAVGQLASGVAHDFNNLLTVIRGEVELLRLELPEGSELRDSAQHIDTAAKRAADLTRQLLAFSRRQMLVPRPVDLNELVAGLQGMLRRLLPESVALETSLAKQAATVHADPGQIEQVVANLVVNARDAIDGVGTITMRTERDGDDVVLEVQDDGCGMGEEVLPRIFEPFFSTKPRDRGTGLGLATVYGIVEQSDGRIDVQSRPGGGARFQVRLPAWDGPAEAPPTTTIDLGGEARRGSETILVAEDETDLRNLVVRALRGQGYRVLEAADGLDAATLAEGYEGRIHALVTDLVMPRMDGRALSERLRAARPDLRVLFVSGYAGHALTDGLLEQSGVALLRKVFTPAQLIEAVGALLDAPPTAAAG